MSHCKCQNKLLIFNLLRTTCICRGVVLFTNVECVVWLTKSEGKFEIEEYSFNII